MRRDRNLRIGIFDSGLGGLTVFKSLSSAFRNQATFFYVGDLAHLPYGEKSKDAIIKYSNQIVEFFINKKVDIIIVACNSASSVALDYLQNFFSIPIVGTIIPSVQEIIENKSTKSVGIIGTDTTINSQAYNEAFLNYNLKIQPKLKINSIACPLFVPIVEEGWENTDIAHQIATKYLSQFKNKLDIVILACTHYPILLDTLKFVFNKLGHKNLNFVESGDAIAFKFYSLSSHSNISLDLTWEENNPILIKPEDEFYVTDTPHQFNNLANKFLGEDINNIQLISL